MSEVIERPLFRDEVHATRWAHQMQYASGHTSCDLTGTMSFNVWTDWSKLDRHAQSAYILSMVNRLLTPPEHAAITARHDIGFNQLNAVHGIAEFVRGTTKNTDDDCLAMIVAHLYKRDLSIRGIAKHYSITERSIQDDLLVIKGHIATLEKLAYEKLRVEYVKYTGLIE